MNRTEALVVVEAIQTEMGEGLLEVLQYMQDNLDQFTAHQRVAFRIVMAGFQEMFA